MARKAVEAVPRLALALQVKAVAGIKGVRLAVGMAVEAVVDILVEEAVVVAQATTLEEEEVRAILVHCLLVHLVAAFPALVFPIMVIMDTLVTMVTNLGLSSTGISITSVALEWVAQQINMLRTLMVAEDK